MSANRRYYLTHPRLNARNSLRLALGQSVNFESQMRRKKPIAEFVRAPKTVQIPLADLKYDETLPEDNQFIALYSKYLTGKLTSVSTRIDIETIVPGFFRANESGTYKNVGLAYDERYLEPEARNIRMGFRPSLYLYKSFVGPAKNKLICSDDLLAFHAYKKLGIRYVPAVILGRHSELLQESGICIRNNQQSNLSSFESLIVHEHTSVPLISDPARQKKHDSKEMISTLIHYVESTRKAVSSFHLSSGKASIHYHHTLHSVLCSMDQLLRAVELLLASGLERQIRPLIRSAYDLFLNFYIDWLHPERMGPVLQALAILGQIAKSRPEHASLNSAIRKSFGTLVDILMNQAEKGRFSPLGSRAHRAIYSGLSPAVHQDFSVTQEFGDSLESGLIEPLPRDELAETLQYLNIVVSAIVIRISDDVGVQLR